MSKLNYLDLFSGIGGFALGAYWAGLKFDNHYFSDIDPYAIKLYQKRFPEAMPLGDIKKINPEELPNGKWIITGGFPCQDISNAGKREGITGERSGLWFDMWEVIRSLRPLLAIMENVTAITFRGLTDVLGSLTEIRYDAEWQDIRASDMGFPHRRQRTWIVAYPSSIGISGLQHELGEPEKIRQGWENPAENGKPGSFRNEGIQKGINKSGLDRMVDGVPHRVDRIKGIGNSIVPQIAELLFRQILQRT